MERGVARRQKISVQMNRRSRSSMLEHQTIKWYVCGVEECLGNMHTEQLAHTTAERWYKQALRTNSEYIDYLQFEKKYLDSTAELDYDGDESTGRLSLSDATLAYPSAADAGNVFQKAYETRMRLLNKLASLYVYDKRFAEAEQLLRDAISAALHCSFSGEKATIVYNVGLLRRKQGVLDEAEKHLRIALQWRESWFGKNHLCVSEVLLQLAAVLTQSRSHADSHAVARPPPYGARTHTHTHSRPCSAMSEPRAHDKFLAESYLRRALSVRIDALGPEHLHVATAQFHLALLLAGQPSRMLKEEARDLLRSGIDTRTKLLGSDHKQTLHMCEKLRALELELRQFSPCASKLQPDAPVTRDRSNTFLSPARMSCPGQAPVALHHTAHVQSPSPIGLTSRRATPAYAHSSRSARSSVSRPDDLPVVSVNVSQHSGGFKTRTHVVGVSKQLLVNGDAKLRDIRGTERSSKGRKHSQAVPHLGLSPAHVTVPRRSASARRLYHDFSQRSSSDEELFIEQPLSGNTVAAAIRVRVPIAGTRHADSSPEETAKAASSGHEFSRRRDGAASAQQQQSIRKWSATQGAQEGDTSVPNASGPERRSSWLRKRREKAIVSTEMQHGHAPFAAQQSEC